MRVSVIIPAINEERLITAAVLSAVRAGADEILVVDGGSQDRTVERAREAGAVTLSAPRGRSTQLNAGASEATGDIFLFLHADTALGPSCIDQARAAIHDGHVHGAFRQKITASGAVYRLLELGNFWRIRACGLPYGDQGIFIVRETFFASGGFPEKRLMEDWLLMKGLRHRHWPASRPGPIHVSARRWQKQGVIRQTLKNLTFSWAAWFGVDPDFLAEAYPLHVPSWEHDQIARGEHDKIKPSCGEEASSVIPRPFNPSAATSRQVRTS